MDWGEVEGVGGEVGSIEAGSTGRRTGRAGWRDGWTGGGLGGGPECVVVRIGSTGSKLGGLGGELGWLWVTSGFTSETKCCSQTSSV